MSEDPTLKSALARLAPTFLPDGDGIDGLKRLSGGASQETWAFNATGLNGAQRALILRRAPDGVADARSENAITLDQEAQLIEAAAAAGAPVPDIVHVCAPDDRIGEAFVMGRVAGETIARKILRDEAFAAARAALPAQCGAALAKIHAMDAATFEDLPVSSGLDQLDRYKTLYLSFDTPRPVLDLAMSWLAANAPAPLPNVLVHGDFRLGNLMVDENGLAAVLDWELAHIGDPREDLAWICVNSWRFGQTDKRVGGFGDLEPLLEAYAAEGGASFSPADIDWWEILGSLKWGVMCMMMYESYRTGANLSIERAMIGRRVSETEIDLINLLEQV
ncbi:MAG: phosphotransferase family protein [Pseudomonadota bacterium]